MLGKEVEVREPDAASLAKVIAFAKATGDYSVLSQPDLHVLALTFQYEVLENGYARVRDEFGKPPKGIKPAHKLQTKNNESAVSQSQGEASSSTLTSAALVSSTSSSDLAAVSTAGPSNPWTRNLPPAPSADQSEEQEDDEEVDEYDEDDFPVLGGDRVWEDVDEHGEGLDGEEQKIHEEGVQEQVQSGPSNSVESAPSTTEDDRPSLVDSYPSAQRRQIKPDQPIYALDDLPVSDDEGDWISPSNVSHQKSIDMGLIPSVPATAPSSSTTAVTPGKKVKGPKHIPQMKAACMTGDFAVQNVLLQMGLNLVGEGGKRIGMVKSWVLRCHACFKVCKDSSKKFCPSCGNPTLIRASVSARAPEAGGSSSSTPDGLHIHLKPNFQYRTRGTVYSIPAPKMGSSKGQSGGGSGLILREDQKEFMSAVRREEGRRKKEDRKLEKAVRQEVEGKGKGLGGWNDPDWLPEMFTVGMSGKGRRGDEQLPEIGYGRRNPNQARRKKR